MAREPPITASLHTRPDSHDRRLHQDARASRGLPDCGGATAPFCRQGETFCATRPSNCKRGHDSSLAVRQPRAVPRDTTSRSTAKLSETLLARRPDQAPTLRRSGAQGRGSRAGRNPGQEHTSFCLHVGYCRPDRQLEHGEAAKRAATRGFHQRLATRANTSRSPNRFLTKAYASDFLRNLTFSLIFQ